MVVSSIQYTIMWLRPWLECLSEVLKGTSGWLKWLHGLQETSTYPVVTQNNFWHLWRATQENPARTWTLDHRFKVICIKNASKSVRYWHQIKMQNKQNPEKNLHHQWQSHPCVVSAPILYRVSIFATSYLIAWRPSGYIGVDILLLLRYSLDLAKILICLNLQKEEEEEEEEEDVTNHKSKQGLKQEVPSIQSQGHQCSLWHIGRRRIVLLCSIMA